MKKPVKTTTVNKPSAAKATKKKPPVPDYYLTDLPPAKGRANIKIEFEEGKATVHGHTPHQLHRTDHRCASRRG